MKQLVLNMSNSNKTRQRTSAGGDRRGSANKLSSLFKCHLSRIVEAEFVWVWARRTLYVCVCVRACVIIPCWAAVRRTHLHTNTESGSPCAAAQHYAGSDNTTIGLCLKVFLVSLSRPLTASLYFSVWVWLNTSRSLFWKNYIRPLEKQNITKRYQEWDRCSWPAIKHFPRPGVNVN